MNRKFVVSAALISPPGISLSGVLSPQRLEMIDRGLSTCSRASAKVLSDDRVEIWLGKDRILLGLTPCEDGFTVEVNMHSERKGSRSVATTVTQWDGQVLLLSAREDPSQIVAATLSLENPSPGRAGDPFAKTP